MIALLSMPICSRGQTVATKIHKFSLVASQTGREKLQPTDVQELKHCLEVAHQHYRHISWGFLVMSISQITGRFLVKHDMPVTLPKKFFLFQASVASPQKEHHRLAILISGALIKFSSGYLHMLYFLVLSLFLLFSWQMREFSKVFPFHWNLAKNTWWL